MSEHDKLLDRSRQPGDGRAMTKIVPLLSLPMIEFHRLCGVIKAAAPDLDAPEPERRAAAILMIREVAAAIEPRPSKARITRRSALALARSLVTVGSLQKGWAASPWSEQVATGTALAVGDQNEVLQTLMAASGEGAKLGSKVTYANFLGGPAVLEAFRAGALDLATVGNTPPVQAQAAGERILIVAAVQASGSAYGIALRPGLSLTRLEDLRGQRIAYSEGTARQPFVLNALKLAGLTRKDVTLVPLRASDVPDAVRSGQVDVAPLNEPHFARYLRDYADRGASALPAAETARVPTGPSYLYAGDAALQNPAKTAAIANFVAHWIAALRWSRAHADAWVQTYYVDRQRLSAADGHKIEDAIGTLSFPALSSLVGKQQAIADLIYDAGDLPKRLDARAEFDFRFDEVIAANAR
jgi:sulfonate transport system substrate-binding protein